MGKEGSQGQCEEFVFTNGEMWNDIYGKRMSLAAQQGWNKRAEGRSPYTSLHDVEQA